MVLAVPDEYMLGSMHNHAVYLDSGYLAVVKSRQHFTYIIR